MCPWILLSWSFLRVLLGKSRQDHQKGSFSHQSFSLKSGSLRWIFTWDNTCGFL